MTAGRPSGDRPSGDRWRGDWPCVGRRGAAWPCVGRPGGDWLGATWLGATWPGVGRRGAVWPSGDRLRAGRRGTGAAGGRSTAGRPAANVAVAGSRRDRGAATIWVLAAGLVLVGMGVAGAAVGTATVARHRAQAAADLGALAGAMRAVEGRQSACARAAEIVTANGGRLAACSLDGFDLTISVDLAVTPVRGLDRTAHASARAGPVRTASQ